MPKKIDPKVKGRCVRQVLVFAGHQGAQRQGPPDAGSRCLPLAADAAGKVDWTISLDATVSRAHQHGTNTIRPNRDTRGSVQPHESVGGVHRQSPSASSSSTPPAIASPPVPQRPHREMTNGPTFP